MEFRVAVAIETDFITTSAHEIKGAVSRVVEVEWAKFTRSFFSEIRGGVSGCTNI